MPLFMNPLKISTRPQRITVRVYGLYRKDGTHLLLCDEVLGQLKVTKFPGGGLIPGEGLLDCLKREWKEETGAELHQVSHLYTTDFFVRSAFDPQAQVICVYYRVIDSDPIVAPVSNQPDFRMPGSRLLRWHPLAELDPRQLYFQTDQTALREFLRKHP